ncbi:Ribosomal protein S3AE [Comamonas aquatilis]|uniref:hypothetical protein n=1 Tax=Comamonas aquatilis TaxID=1778406 RepID=UPI0039EE8004
MPTTPPIRTECPPGSCICERERLLATPGADWRILMLTREEEKRLLLRLESISSLQDLRHMQLRMAEQLGLSITIGPGRAEVRTMRGIQIEIADQPGLCRKTRQSIPAAIRKGLEHKPEIAYALLDAHDLFGMPG